MSLRNGKGYPLPNPCPNRITDWPATRLVGVPFSSSPSFRLRVARWHGCLQPAPPTEQRIIHWPENTVSQVSKSHTQKTRAFDKAASNPGFNKLYHVTHSKMASLWSYQTSVWHNLQHLIISKKYSFLKRQLIPASGRLINTTDGHSRQFRGSVQFSSVLILAAILKCATLLN